MPARRRRHGPSWPFIICDFLSKKPEKSAELEELLTYLLKTHPHPLYKKVQDLRTIVLRSAYHESWKRKSPPRFIRCPTTDKLLLTDFQWIKDQQNNLRRSSSSDCKSTLVNNVPNHSNYEAIVHSTNESIMPSPYIKADSCKSIDSKKEILPKLQFEKTRVRVKNSSTSIDSRKQILSTLQSEKTRVRVKKEKGTSGSTYAVINLISDDEDDNPNSSVAECKIKCPVCQATFLTYEGVGVHVQMHR